MEKKIIRNEFYIPPVGFGTWPLKGSELESCMETAVSVGYRLFDTADNYGNEDSIGNVIAKNPQLRKELFIMTKISDEKSANNRWSSTGKYFYKNSPYMQVHSCREVVDMIVEKSLRNLKTDYIDCLVMHWPYPDYMLEIWEEMIRLQERGVLRFIGVSNFRERHLEKIKQNFSVYPIVNQICVSPLDTKKSLIDYCQSEEIQVLCYAPLQTIRNVEYVQDSLVCEILNNSEKNLYTMHCSKREKYL